jgi:ADP-ribose pyrophosphatase YjhB (NUDIX family)
MGVVAARYAGVIVTSGEDVLLVREYHDDVDREMWGAPNGRVDEDETFAEGAARELAEEAGIEVDPADLELVAWTEMETPDGISWRSATFAAEVRRVAPVPRDPDGLVTAAAWFPLERAIALIGEKIHLPVVEPIIHHLLDGGPPSTWRYQSPYEPGERTPRIEAGSQPM